MKYTTGMQTLYCALYAEAVARVREAVKACERERGRKAMDVRELAAVFRRGEVLEKLRSS